MNFLIKIIVFFMAIALVLGVFYAVLSPVLDGLGIELGDIFNQASDKSKDETQKADETTEKNTETTAPECKHVYDDAWSYHSETQHKKLCKQCGEKTLYAPHEFNTEGICGICRYIKSDSDNPESHECDFTVFVKKELGFHVLKCSNTSCEQFKTIPHDYGDWKTVTEATCTEKGKESRTCSYSECKHVDYRDIPILSHVMDNGTILSSPTCKNDGEKVYTCLNCDHKEYVTIDTVDHYYTTVSESCVSINDTQHQFVIKAQCVYCDASITNTYTREHFFENNICPVCNYECSCLHEDTEQRLTNKYNCLNSDYHEVICQECCLICDEVLSEFGEYFPHSFDGNVCFECGYTRTSSGGSSDGSVSCEHADVIDTGDTLYCKTVYWSVCSYCGVILDTSVYYDYSCCGDGDGDNCCDGCGKTLSTSSGGGTTSCSHPYGYEMFEGDCCSWRYLCEICFAPAGDYISGDKDGDGYCDICGSGV